MNLASATDSRVQRSATVLGLRQLGISARPVRGYLRFSYGGGRARLLSRCSVGRSLSRLPSLLVVALFRTAFPPGTAGEVVAQEGIAPLKVALPALADR